MREHNHFDERIEQVNRDFRLYRNIFLVALMLGVMVNGALYFLLVTIAEVCK